MLSLEIVGEDEEGLLSSQESKSVFVSMKPSGKIFLRILEVNT